LAKLLRKTYGLSKAKLGELLGSKKEQHAQILPCYLKTFDWTKHKSYNVAFREFLQSFRIPGEAPVISRILEQFANYFSESAPGVFANNDAAYILAYSTLMLNVDQHNPEVKNRMTEDDFVRNNRGINNGQNLPREMLVEIYHSVRDAELKIVEEMLAR